MPTDDGMIPDEDERMGEVGDYSDVRWPHKPEKFKGERMGDLPSNFLKWIAENATDDSLAEAADKEYDYREMTDSHEWE